MSKTIPYTQEQLQDKFVVCSKVTLMQKSVLATVTYSGGPHAGFPYLYDSIPNAENDRYFDPLWDEVVPAEDYFKRLHSTKNTVSHE